jgi:hypothetical protein
MDFLGLPTDIPPRIDAGPPKPKVNYNQLAYEATDGLTSQVDFEQTRLMLLYCWDAGRNLYEERVRNEIDMTELYDRTSQEADGAVPVGTFDAWMAFTDLKGWEHESYYDAATAFDSDRDDADMIPKTVLYDMCVKAIESVIEEFEAEARWFND